MKSIFSLTHFHKRIAGLFILTIAVGWLSTATAQFISDEGWKEFGKSYWPTEAVNGGVYKTASPKYVGLMNPNHWPINDFTTLARVYERLVYRDGQSRASVPYLIESWKYLDSKTAITRLRKGVQFHDGTDFDAQAMKYQIDWINDKKNGCWDRAYLILLKSVEVIDDYTLKWHFKKPWAAFAGSVMAGIPGWPISAHALKNDLILKEVDGLKRKIRTARKKVIKAEKKAEKLASSEGKKAEKARKKLKSEQKKLTKLDKKLKKLEKQTAGTVSTDRHAVGTGMYMVEEGRPGNYLLLKRNPNWWFANHVGRPQMPYFDKMKVMVIPDPSIQLANLRIGKIHSMTVDKSMYRMLKRDPNLTVHIVPKNRLGGLIFNHAKGAARDIRVRKAVSHAIDRRAIIVGTQFGMAEIASGMFPEDHWCYNPELEPVPYDPELSKKLLADAGYTDGLTLNGNIVNTPEANNLTLAISGMLKKVGITWKVDILESGAATNRLQNLEFELSGMGFYGVNDPDLVATRSYHPEGGFNYGRSKNEEAIKLIEAGRGQVNVDKRRKIYQQLGEVLYNNYEDVWIYWRHNVDAYNKKVQGYNNEMMKKYMEGYYLTHPLWFKEGK